MVTFGAPMILHSPDEGALYAALGALGDAAQRPGVHLRVHNCVNNADVVPRALGPQLDSMYQAVHSMVPSIEVGPSSEAGPLWPADAAAPWLTAQHGPGSAQHGHPPLVAGASAAAAAPAQAGLWLCLQR